MIQRKELRIGNLVNRKCLPHKIEQLHLDVVYHTGQYFNSEYSQITPIPLTPEILEKCGFEKLYLPHIDQTTEKWSIAGFTLEVYNGEVLWKGYWTTPMPIKHLHQLQNLYFALTGTELNPQI